MIILRTKFFLKHYHIHFHQVLIFIIIYLKNKKIKNDKRLLVNNYFEDESI